VVVDAWQIEPRQDWTFDASPRFSPTIHALDADGVGAVLEKHGEKFYKAFERTVRKLNH
jgi:hypothetical protein